MFNGSPIFVRRFSQTGGAGWFLMAPGLVLTLTALAILVWPELLAYMVAGVMLFIGLSLVAWGWASRPRTRRAQRAPQQDSVVYYEVR
jgi:uncharacterized membrane protein